MPRAHKKKLLLLSVGYGKGHHSAAAALAGVYAEHGWESRVVDVCELAQPFLFRLTQRFYAFCVRQAPWIWGITYRLTDAADWALLIHSPMLRPVVRCLRRLLSEDQPDLVVCTYPLFAYMLDELRGKGYTSVPYAVVVTDAREISRPWMCSGAPLVIVPDAGSRHRVMERYANSRNRVEAAGFPVCREFFASAERRTPDETAFRIVYGAYRQIGGVLNDVTSLLAAFPQLRMTVLAGRHEQKLQQLLSDYCASGRLQIMAESTQMAELLRESHLYIGKAGAATMFECYASAVPMLVNFILPGQEEGNLELLLEDGAGCHVESTAHMVDTVHRLLENGAEGWLHLKNKMIAAGRQHGAERIVDTIKHFLRV